MSTILNPLLGAGTKGLPLLAQPLPLNQIGQQGWNILKGDVSFPIAVIHQQQLQHNLQWLQHFANQHGIQLAPHGKTTMSPQLFQKQLNTGAWGMTVSTLAQLYIALQAGATQCLIANELLTPLDLATLDQLQQQHPQLKIYFLIDSLAQLALLEAYPTQTPFKVLLEIGVLGGRAGVRDQEDAFTLARAIHQSPTVQLAGVECYEGLVVTADDQQDKAYVASLMQRVLSVVNYCEQEQLFDYSPVILSAGGSALFDLVLPALKTQIKTPLVGLLRSGCYITHDHGFYQRVVTKLNQRLGCGTGLEAALQVWAVVVSMPEPDLAIIGMGKRDISYDIEMPIPVQWNPQQTQIIQAVPTEWKVSHMNDQHAYLRLQGQTAGLKVGDRIGFGVSHPCTTFDKWRWMPVINERYDIVDAISTCF